MINKYIDTTILGLRIPVYNHSSSLTAKTIWSLLWYIIKKLTKDKSNWSFKGAIDIHLGISDGHLCNTWKELNKPNVGLTMPKERKHATQSAELPTISCCSKKNNTKRLCVPTIRPSHNVTEVSCVTDFILWGTMCLSIGVEMRTCSAQP